MLAGAEDGMPMDVDPSPPGEGVGPQSPSIPKVLAGTLPWELWGEPKALGAMVARVRGRKPRALVAMFQGVFPRCAGVWDACLIP